MSQAARRHADEYCKKQLGYGASNMRFVEGHIEYLDAAGIEDSSVRPAMPLIKQRLDSPTEPPTAARRHGVRSIRFALCKVSSQ